MFIRKPSHRVMLAALLLCGTARCQAECDGLLGEEKPGLDPSTAQFYFPTGLATTPDGRYLFVTNGDTDLKYNGGTLTVVDLEEAETRLAHPEDYAGSCRYAPQDPLVVECQEGRAAGIDGLILKDLTMRVGFYPSFLALEDLSQVSYTPWLPEDDGGDMRRYRLYTPVRGDPSVTFVDVLVDADENVTCLDCGQGCSGGAPRDCDAEYRIESPSDGRIDFLPDDLPDEPYALVIQPEGGYMLVAHLVGGALTLVDLSGYQGDLRRGGPDIVDVLEDVMGSDAEGRSGGFNAVLRNPDDPLDWIYVSNRAAAQIVSLRVAGGDAEPAEDRGLRLVLGPSIVLTAPFGPLESGADVRGVAMGPDGNRLYALSRTPPSLLVVDTSFEDGMPRNEFLDTVEICPKPSVLRIRRGPLGRTLAYTVCYASGEIYVVDTEDAFVVDRIEAGGGPHDLVFPDGGDPAGYTGPLPNVGLIANFAEHSIGVIDVDPESPTYHQMIGRLGLPEELKQ